MVTEFKDYTKPLEAHFGKTLCKAIVGLLKGSHVGKMNSIKAELLTCILTEMMGRDVSVRALQLGISSLRMRGEPICSWHRGYYYMNTDIEMNLTIQSLTDRMIALAAEVDAMSKKYAELYGKRPKLVFKDLKCHIDNLISIEVDQNNVGNNY